MKRLIDQLKDKKKQKRTIIFIQVEIAEQDGINVHYVHVNNGFDQLVFQEHFLYKFHHLKKKQRIFLSDIKTKQTNRKPISFAVVCDVAKVDK